MHKLPKGKRQAAQCECHGINHRVADAPTATPTTRCHLPHSHLQLRLQRRQLVPLRPLRALQLGNARLQRVGVALLEWIGDGVRCQLLAVGCG